MHLELQFVWKLNHFVRGDFVNVKTLLTIISSSGIIHTIFKQLLLRNIEESSSTCCIHFHSVHVLTCIQLSVM